MYTTFALHHITQADQLPFCAAAYSRFKFGDGAVAHDFGSALGAAFVERHGDDLLRESHIVYVPSPYDAIPTASFAMAEAFRDTVNLFLYQHGKSALLSSKIHRYKTYTVDYGNLSYEERLRLISSDTYHLDKTFLQGRMVLFLDDIRITGSHETIIQRQIAKEGISGNFFFLYYALLDNPEVAPQFENYLNYYEVNDIRKIATLFSAPQYRMNTRVVKYILQSNPSDVRWLLGEAPRERIRELTTYALGNNYHLMDDYKTNLNTLIQTAHHGY